MRDSGLPTMF